MNIFILGNAYFADSLRKRGCRVINANYHESADLPLEQPVLWKHLKNTFAVYGFSPDFVLYADNGNLPMLIDPENIDCPSLYYSIDTYCNPWHPPYAHAFDMAWVAQKDFVGLFTDDGQNAKWVPLFCRQEGNVKPFAQREIPVSFVGGLGHKNNPQRKPFLLDFNSHFPLNIQQGDFHPVFDNSRIVLNQTAFGELNFRCFEAMAMGAALLMEKCENGFGEIFSPGENIMPPFPRHDARIAAQIASVWLKRPAALAAIAERGREYVLTKHGEDARAETLLQDAEALLQNGGWRQRLQNAARIQPYTRAAFGMIGSEMDGAELRPYRDFFITLAKGQALPATKNNS